MKRKPYPSDLTDEQWALLEPLIPPARPGGRPRKTDMRDVVDALFYLTREGCTWRALPHDFPPWKTVHNYFTAWTRDGTWDRLNTTLREQVRRAAGRQRSPRTASLDSQSVKTDTPGEEQGYDAAKKVKGRKRHILVDSLGLLLAVWLTAADVDDAAAAPEVLGQLDYREVPRLRKIYADNKYHNHALYAWVDTQWYDLEVVSRPKGAKGFVLLPKRWVVERTFAWLGRYRRLSKDREVLPESSEAMVKLSMIHVMLRRLKPAGKKQRFRFKRKRRRAA
jgi:putative transposase